VADRKKVKHKLFGINVDSVGLVDSPAINRRFIIMKRKEKALGEGVGVGGERQGIGGAKYCVCPSCGYTMKHERKGEGESKPCAELTCPKCGAKMKGSNTRNLSKEVNEMEVVPKDELDEIITETEGAPVEKEDLDEKLNAIADAVGLEEEEKSAYTKFMGTCMRGGKSMKECVAEWKKKKTAKSDEENVVELIADTLGLTDEEKSAWSKCIGEQRKAGKSMKEAAAACKLKLKKSGEEVEKAKVRVTVDTEEEKEAEKKYPPPGEKYPGIEAGSFKTIFSTLDGMIKASKGDTKKAFQKVKSMLSKVIGGTYPYPAPTSKKLDELDPKFLEILEKVEKKATEVEGVKKDVAELVKSVKVLEEKLESIPIRKGLTGEGETREGEVEKLQKSEEWKEANPKDRLEMLLGKVEKLL